MFLTADTFSLTSCFFQKPGVLSLGKLIKPEH